MKYFVEEKLYPVILNYLIDLKSELIKKDPEDPKTHANSPLYYWKLQAEKETNGLWSWGTKVDQKAAHEIHLTDIDELIWTFSAKHPDYKQYEAWDEGFVKFNQDRDEWGKRKKNGFNLFAKMLQKGCLNNF